MFKQFLMDNAHNTHVQHLFRWWNGHVFTRETTKGKQPEGHREDSGMDEALKALDSDEEFGDKADSWYVQDEPEVRRDGPEIHRNELTVDFFNSDHAEIPPSIPAALTNTTIPPQIRTSTPAPIPRVREPPQIREPTPANTITAPQAQVHGPIHDRSFLAPRVRGFNDLDHDAAAQKVSTSFGQFLLSLTSFHRIQPLEVQVLYVTPTLRIPITRLATSGHCYRYLLIY
jgi:hypothetical protein